MKFSKQKILSGLFLFVVLASGFLVVYLAMGGGLGLFGIGAHPGEKTFGCLVWLLIFAAAAHAFFRVRSSEIPFLQAIPDSPSPTRKPLLTMGIGLVLILVGAAISAYLSSDGLNATYEFEVPGGEIITRQEAWTNIAFCPGGLRVPIPEAKSFRVRADGRLFIPISGTYTLDIEQDSLCGLTIDDGKEIQGSNSVETVTQRFQRGWHTVRLVYWDGEYSSRLKLCWRFMGLPVAGAFFSRMDNPTLSYGYFRLILYALRLILILVGIGLLAAAGNALSSRQLNVASIAVLIIGWAYRLWLCKAADWYVNGDESLLLAIARDIHDGTSFPAFYYAQAYMGALVSYVLAPFVDMPVDIRILYRLWEVSGYTAAGFVWLWMLRRYINARAAWFWALLFSLSSASVLTLSMATNPFGFPLLLTSLLVLAGVKLAVDTDNPRAWWRVWGLCAGLGYWLNGQTLPFIATTFLFAWVGFRRGRWKFEHLVDAIPTALLGASPALIYDLVHDGGAFRTLLGWSEGQTIIDVLKALWYALFYSGYSTLIGGRYQWANGEEIAPAILARGVYLIALLAFVSFIYRCANSKKSGSERMTLMLILAVSFVFMLAAAKSRFALGIPPRYLFMAIPPTFAFIAVGADYWAERGPRFRWSVGVAIGMLVWWNFYTVYAFPVKMLSLPSHFNQMGLYPRGDFTPELAFFKENKIEAIGGTHWIAPPISAQTAFKFPCQSDVATATTKRYLASRYRAWVTHPNDMFSIYCRPLFEKVFKKRYFSSPYEIFYDDLPWQDMTGWVACAWHNPDEAYLAIDGDINRERAWNSYLPQDEGHWFQIDFKHPIPLNQIVVFRGRAGFLCPVDVVEQVPNELGLEYCTNGVWQTYGSLTPQLNDGIHWANISPPISAEAIKLVIVQPRAEKLWVISEAFVR